MFSVFMVRAAASFKAARTVTIPVLRGMRRRRARLTAVAAICAVITTAAAGSIRQQAGPYQVELAADPPTIRVGTVKLLIRVNDGAGRPVDGAHVSAIAQMPGMP